MDGQIHSILDTAIRGYIDMREYRYFVTNINNTTKYIDYHRERPSRTKHLDALIEPNVTEDQGMRTVTARVQIVR